MRPTKILVTGGAGFIGSHVAERMANQGTHVVVYDNFTSGTRSNLSNIDPDRLTIVEADVADADALAKSIASVSAVVHLAALPSVTASLEDPVGTHRENFVNTMLVLEAMRATGVRDVVYASSAAVYGGAHTSPAVETVTGVPESQYGLDKLFGEHLLHRYAKTFGIRSASLRFFNVFGPRQVASSPYSGVISRFVEAGTRGGRIVVFGDGLQTRDFIYVKDIAEYIARALESLGDEPLVANVGTGRACNLRELVQTLTEIGLRFESVDSAPRRAGEVMHSVADTSRLHETLGRIAGTSLHDGLRDLVATVETAGQVQES